MLRNMEYVYEVYKQGSFTKAAKSLYVSQPCLSALVKKTEEKLGFPIFNRNSNPLQLTECGQEYIRYIDRRLLSRHLIVYSIHTGTFPFCG